ncbi:MAG: putative metalloprotease CJM1_0395 family protein [Lentisphaerota bacterium]
MAEVAVMISEISMLSTLHSARSVTWPKMPHEQRSKVAVTEEKPIVLKSSAALEAVYSQVSVVRRFEAKMNTSLSSPSLNRSLVGLNQREEEEVTRLRARDQVVRLHEARHAAALGASAGVTRYTFDIGPDGRAYAVGGSIEVNAMPASTPEASVAKARMLRSAAMAGGEPSGADFAMACEATRMEQSALRRQG